MITTTDIANILYRDCKSFGMNTYQKGNIPMGEVTEERVIIRTRTKTPEKYWEKGFIEVNLCVPDLKDGVANLIRLNELEREAEQKLKYSSGAYDDTRYRYSIDTVGIESDSSLRCHYVNIKILFEILNTK